MPMLLYASAFLFPRNPFRMFDAGKFGWYTRQLD